MGDRPILLAAGGAWVGWAGLPIVLLFAGLTELGLVLARRVRGARPRADRPTPFGAFLAAGIWLTWSLPL